ncbi:MAG TPA: hypothetical protein VI733_05100 [Candidatus Limnocylindria bacterium]|nr:hypothetical protein [Candidatus Limnocylindria bacterium]
MDNPIDDYIRQNRERYTREAIREALIAGGHEPAAVEEALQRIGAQTTDEGAARSRTARALRRVTVILFVVGGLVGLGGFAIGGSYFGGSLPVFLLAYFGGAGVITALIRWVLPRFGGVRTWAPLIFLALFPAYYGLLAGACLAARQVR